MTHSNIRGYNLSGPRLLWFLKKMEEPQVPLTTPESYDLLSSYEPTWYPPGEYEKWAKSESKQYERALERFNKGFLEIGKVGVLDSNVDEQIRHVESTLGFVRWIKENETSHHA